MKGSSWLQQDIKTRALLIVSQTARPREESCARQGCRAAPCTALPASSPAPQPPSLSVSPGTRARWETGWRDVVERQPELTEFGGLSLAACRSLESTTGIASVQKHRRPRRLQAPPGPALSVEAGGCLKEGKAIPAVVHGDGLVPDFHRFGGQR